MATAPQEQSLIELAERLVADAQSHAQSARRLAEEADSQVRTSQRRALGQAPADASGSATVTRASDELAAGAQKLAQAAFALDMKVKFARSTNRFRAWQQIPAWGLAAGGLSLAFYLASRGDDFNSNAAWFTVTVILVLAVITMFRGPADLSLGTGGRAAPTGPGRNEPAPPSEPKPDAPDGAEARRGQVALAPRPPGAPSRRGTPPPTIDEP